MSKLERMVARTKSKKLKKDAIKKIGSSINMFDRIPNECNTCSEHFDKKSKEMAQTWIVTVYSEQKIVKLFCPECVRKTKEKIENED